MSDQKTEDTKSPLARRGARPFVGPAGGSGAARPPLFKPAPATRVASTPALPPRPALGALAHAPAAVPPVTPIAPPAPAPTLVAEQPASAIMLPPVQQIIEPAAAELSPLPSEPDTLPVEALLPVAPLRPTTPARTFEITIPEPVVAAETAPEPVAEQYAPEQGQWSAAVTPAYTPSFQSVIDEVPTADDVMSSFAEPAAEPTVPSQDASHPDSSEAPEPPMTRPVTSEMVAIDAFEAFETVWDATPEPEPTPAGAREASVSDDSVAASPLDGESLGSGIDAQQLWGDEITRDADDDQAYDVDREQSTDDSGEEAPLEAGWASHTTPELPMPAWLADDAPSELFESPPDPLEPLPNALPPASHEATSSSIVGSVPSASPWTDPRIAAYAAFVTSPDGVPAISNAIANDKQLRGLQVSAALQRLAERIRDGEIDVSSVAPEAPDAAMLASVLAALLGGSNSR